MDKYLTSAQNEKIKQLIRLKDKKERDKTSLFLVEGYREILRAYESKARAHSLYICPELFLKNNEQKLVSSFSSPCFLVEKKLFEKISYRDRPDGLIAIFHTFDTNLDVLSFSKKDPCIVVAESIEKPGNLGTILRSSDAAGVDAVIVVDHCTDIYNPNVVRSSVGTLFTLPVLQIARDHLYPWLKEKGFLLVATTPHAKKEYTDVAYKGPLAVLVGTEQLGLSSFWMEQAAIQVKIPMKGKADSLNVATATTLILYEILRQRSSTALS